MTRTAVCAAFLMCMTVHVNAAEWDASRYALGAHAGYVGLKNDSATPGLRLSATASLSVPLIVEQHLLMTPIISFHYQPMIAPEQEGLVGGNYLSGSFAFLIEHDFNLGSLLGWFGAGPQLSVNATAGHYEWISTGAGLKAVEIENTLGLSADLLARVGADLNTHYSMWLSGQYSPLSDAYSGVSVGATYKF